MILSESIEEPTYYELFGHPDWKKQLKEWLEKRDIKNEEVMKCDMGGYIIELDETSKQVNKQMKYNTIAKFLLTIKGQKRQRSLKRKLALMSIYKVLKIRTLFLWGLLILRLKKKQTIW